MGEYLLEEERWPSGMTAPQRAVLRTAPSRFREDRRLIGVVARGSLAAGSMDEFSDLDLALLVEPSARAKVLESMPRLAGLPGHLLVCFSGDHVGQPDLLICLYGPSPVSADFRVETVEELRRAAGQRALLWERGSELRRLCPADPPAPAPPPADWQWIEDRFWHWVHYSATRIGRGELFEAARILDLLRVRVLGPLALAEAGAHPYGVKRLERVAPMRAAEMRGTVCAYDRRELVGAMRTAVALYRSLRRGAPATLLVRSEAEAVAVSCFDEVAARIVGADQ